MYAAPLAPISRTLFGVLAGRQVKAIKAWRSASVLAPRAQDRLTAVRGLLDGVIGLLRNALSAPL